MLRKKENSKPFADCGVCTWQLVVTHIGPRTPCLMGIQTWKKVIKREKKKVQSSVNQAEREGCKRGSLLESGTELGLEGGVRAPWAEEEIAFVSYSGWDIPEMAKGKDEGGSYRCSNDSAAKQRASSDCLKERDGVRYARRK